MRAYRHEQLVYIPTYKNAATSYEHLFSKILNWEIILTENINWENDVVFGHISDPYVRHLRGTVQFLIQYNLKNIVDDKRFNRLLTSGYFDQHSYPLTLMFGEKSKKITWLPIDSIEYSSEKVTTTFLKKYGISIDLNQIPRLNISPEENRQLLNQIKEICIAHNYQHTGLFFMLDDDMILYQHAIINLSTIINSKNINA